MGKTYKDKANYFIHKDKRDEAPNELLDKIDLLSDTGSGARWGNSRKDKANDKLRARRTERRRHNRNNPEY